MVQDVLFPYVTVVTYATDTINVLVGETVNVAITAASSNLQNLEGALGCLLDFLVVDEAIASLELTAEGELAITGVAVGATTLTVDRKPGTVAPRRPQLADIEVLPAVPTITVS